jgi:tRNA C32,U32 (ribose-2'-O)-methylase TrmJ
MRPSDVVEKIRIYDDLKSALSQFQYIAATTARLRSKTPGNSVAFPIG